VCAVRELVRNQLGQRGKRPSGKRPSARLVAPMGLADHRAFTQ